MRRAVSLCALAYLGAQLFQEWAYARLGEPATALDELRLGPLNHARAAVLLLSFFPLAFVFLALCERITAPLAARAARTGLLTFCGLELGLRSVELFWGYQRLPALGARGVELFEVFQGVQGALYFPLLAAQCVGSAALAAAFPRRERADSLVTAAFALNAARCLGRLLGAYLHVSALDALAGSLYVPVLLLVFLPLIAWGAWPGSVAAAAPRPGTP